MAANIFTGATNSNWGTSTNWSLGTVPTASDGHVATFNGASPACTVNASNRVCNAIDFTGYTNTITFTFNITVSGNVTLSATMTFSGAGTLLVSAASTLTSNGKTVNIPFTLSGNVTHTLADNWTVTGNLNVGSNTTQTINGNTLNVGSNFQVNPGATGVITGTTSFVLNGTGTVTYNASGGSFRNNLTINTAGTITFASGATFITGTNTLTYTAGTVVTAGATISIIGATTINLNGIVIESLVITGQATTMTLSSNLSCVNLTCVTGTLGLVLNGSTLFVSGNMAVNQTGANVLADLSGTTNIEYTGTGTLSSTLTISEITNNFTVNTSGTLTLSGTIRYSTGTWTHTAGTVTGAGSTLQIATASPTFAINAPGVTFGTIEPSVSVSFGGTEGFAMQGFLCSTVGITITWKSSETYTVSSSVVITGTAASHIFFNSSTGGVRAIWTILAGCTQDVGFCNATDIDSSLGQTVFSYKGGSPIGTFPNTLNWRNLQYSDLARGYAYTF